MADNKGTEIELKLRVADLAALMRICVAAGAKPKETATQRNEYLDTPGKGRKLDAAKYVLRLREESTATLSTTYLTAKGPAQKSADGTLSFVPEEEIEVPVTTAAAIRAGTCDVLALLDNGSDQRKALVKSMRDVAGEGTLVVVGGFTNERTRLDVDFPEGFKGTLELDRVVFPGDQIHHEVEFEVPAGVDPLKAKAAFEALFARGDVKGSAAPGKASRFFKALKGERLS
ncbi:MAG: CYTH domain-containing protein [Deltaproteobacteria bacterium]|nr:CYTH domain-containing protein [Deltaproteobacteria bacterium]